MVDVSKYKALFLTEAAEARRSLEDALLALERDVRERDAVDRAFRAAHSLKGMAGAMGYEGIARVAHGVEDALDLVRLRGGDAPLDVSSLLFALDAIGGALAELGGEPVAAASIDDALARLSRPVPARPATARTPTTPSALSAPSAPTTPSHDARDEPSKLRPGDRVIDVDVFVAARSSSPAVRAFIAYRKLAGLGVVLAASPTLDSLRAGRFEECLRLSLGTVASASDVEAVLSSVPELERFEVRERGVVTSASAAVSLTATVAEPLRPRAAEAARHEPAVTPRPPSPLLDKGAGGTVRVRTELLDRFMDSLTELLLAKAQLAERVRGVGRRDVEEGLRDLERAVRGIHDRVMEVRLLSMGSVLHRLPRIVRDLAVGRRKRVVLEVEGADVEVDRAVVEAVDVPLLHIVRNAVDHGLETPEERLAAGKPPDGRLRLCARRGRGEVILEVSDDGRGIDTTALRRRARERGLVDDDALAAMDEREARELIFLPGLSTASEVTELSGRGVGMDAARAVIEGLGGRLELDSERGQGTRFTLHLPVTVTVVQVLAAREGNEVYAFPTTKLERTHLALEHELVVDGGRARYRRDDGALLPVHRLADLLGVPRVGPSRWPMPLAVVGTDAGPVALAVDAFIGQREVVLRPLGKLLERIDGLAGITIFGDGRPVFLLDGARLCRGLGR